jgi:hypothetical protein
MEDEMAIRRADAERRGNLAQGSGHMRLGAAHLMARTASARMGDGKGTNPESGLAPPCRALLNGAGASADECGLHRQTNPYNSESPFEECDGRWSIHRIDLNTVASVSDIAAAAFEEQAQSAKNQEELPGLVGPVRGDIRLVAKSSELRHKRHSTPPAPEQNRMISHGPVGRSAAAWQGSPVHKRPGVIDCRDGLIGLLRLFRRNKVD